MTFYYLLYSDSCLSRNLGLPSPVQLLVIFNPRKKIFNIYCRSHQPSRSFCFIDSDVTGGSTTNSTAHVRNNKTVTAFPSFHNTPDKNMLFWAGRFSVTFRQFVSMITVFLRPSQSPISHRNLDVSYIHTPGDPHECLSSSCWILFFREWFSTFG